MILWRADEDAKGREAANKPVAQATPHNQWRWESPRFGQIALDPGTYGAPPLAPGRRTCSSRQIPDFRYIFGNQWAILR